MSMILNLTSDLPKKEATPEHLGGKGYGLYWMASQGVNVPPALCIPTSICVEYMVDPASVMQSIAEELPSIKSFFTSKFGYMPLLSIRSGARVSMPGMMDTILNVGIDEDTEEFWSNKLGSSCFVDSTQRLITMFGSVVHGLDRHELEKDDLSSTLAVYERAQGDFPGTDVQILSSIEAVFKSWNNERAKYYRQMNNIPEEWGTAVVLQAMVFGNLNDKSGTGVLFTRNPDTGENSVTGEFLVNAQGEDVVAGIRTPLPLSDLSMAWEGAGAIHHNLCVAVKKLEAARKDMQDVEFTIQDGELFILQTRNAKRSARAAVVIALAMTDECLINPKELIKRVSLRDLDLAQLAVLDPSFKEKPDYVGLSACSGIVTGIPVFSTEDAINCKEPCILITEETTPDDIAGMDAAVGVLTMSGGATSHAAVVARGMNKPCVVGLGKTKDDFGCFKVSINGATGEVWLKEVPIVSGDSELHDHFYSKVVAHTSMIPMAQRPIKGVSVQGVSLAGGLFDLNSCLDKVQEVYEVVKDYPLALIYVDTNTGDLTPEERSMNSLFSPYKNLAGGEKALVLALENLPLEVRSKLLLVGTVKSKVLASIPRLSGLEDLILTEGDALLSPGNWKGVSLKALSKVLDWKKTDTPGTNLIAHCGADVPQVKNCCLLGSPEAVLLSLH